MKQKISTALQTKSSAQEFPMKRKENYLIEREKVRELHIKLRMCVLNVFSSKRKVVIKTSEVDFAPQLPPLSAFTHIPASRHLI